MESAVALVVELESSLKVTSKDARSGLLRQTAHPVIVDQDDGKVEQRLLGRDKVLEPNTPKR